MASLSCIALYRDKRYIRAMTKQATSYRLSEATMRRIKALAARLELSHAAVIEQAVRLLARREGIGKGEG